MSTSKQTRLLGTSLPKTSPLPRPPRGQNTYAVKEGVRFVKKKKKPVITLYDDDNDDDGDQLLSEFKTPTEKKNISNS